MFKFFSQQVYCLVLTDFLNSLLEMRCTSKFGLLELRISRSLKCHTYGFNSSGPVASSTVALVLNHCQGKIPKISFNHDLFNFSRFSDALFLRILRTSVFVTRT